jgi:hypothetical protein
MDNHVSKLELAKKKHNFWRVFRSSIDYVLKYFLFKIIFYIKFQSLLILKIPRWTWPACPAYTIKAQMKITKARN